MLTIKPFGAFAEIDGFASHGLVHISQLAPRRVETVEEVVNVGDTVKVKVISVEMGENGRSKVSLSMKQVDQATGQDLGDVGGGGGGGGGGGRREYKRREDGEDLTQFQFGTGQLSALEYDDDADAAPDAPKIKPNYEATGKLAESANKINGVGVNYGEPPDATKPTKHWRLYVFKGKEAIDPYHIHRQSMYLMGRERRVADIPLDHPSCSSQHCVLQFRMTQKTETNEHGQRRESKLVRPYLIDLGSTNGCYVNGERIEAQRYVELLEKDCLRFGYSSREYVLLNADNDNK